MYIQPFYLTTVQVVIISAELRQDIVDWLIMVCTFMRFLWFMSLQLKKNQQNSLDLKYAISFVKIYVDYGNFLESE